MMMQDNNLILPHLLIGTYQDTAITRGIAVVVMYMFFQTTHRILRHGYCRQDQHIGRDKHNNSGNSCHGAIPCFFPIYLFHQVTDGLISGFEMMFSHILPTPFELDHPTIVITLLYLRIEIPFITVIF